MKTLKRVFVFALVVTMVLSVPISVSAKGTDRYVVTCIGDSSPNGNCLANVACAPNGSPRLGLVYTNEMIYIADDGTEYSLGGAINGDKHVDYHFYLPDDISPEEYEAGMLQSYPVRVAEELNGITAGSVTDFETFYELTGYRSMTASAIRTGDVLYAIDSSYTQDDALWNLPMSEIKRAELTSAVENGAIDEADCVILSFGSNDVFAGPLYELVLSSENGEKGLPALKNGIREGISNFKNNFPRILEKLQQRNSDCIYVITGAYNPVYQYTIRDILMLLEKDIGIFGNIAEIGNLADFFDRSHQ